MKLNRPMWKVNLSYRWTAKAQWSLHVHAVSPEPSLFAQTIWATRASLRQKSRGSSPTHWLRVRIWRITKVPFVVRWLRYMSKSVTGSMLYIWYASQIKRTIKLYAGMIKHYLNGYNHLTLYVKASRVFQVSWPDLGLALTLNIIFWILSKQAYTCPRINTIAVNPM